MIRLKNWLSSFSKTAPAEGDIDQTCRDMTAGFDAFQDMARGLLWDQGTAPASLRKLLAGIDAAIAAGGLPANSRVMARLYRSMAQWRLGDGFDAPFGNLTEARLQFWETEYYCPLAGYQMEFVRVGQERWPTINLFNGMVRIFDTTGPVQSDFRDTRNSEVVTHLRPGATRTLICFAALNQNPLGIGWATFERAVARPLNANLFIFKDFQKRFFLAGCKTIGNYQKTIDHLAGLIRKYRNTQITFVGCSGGTFGALNFASQLDVNHVVGLSGPNSLSLGEGFEEKHTYQQIYQAASSGRIPFPDLIAQLRASRVRRFDYFISEHHEFDMIQFRNAADNLDIVAPHLYPVSTHSMTDLAIEDGGLLRAFTDPLAAPAAVASDRTEAVFHIGHASARSDAARRLLARGAVAVDGQPVAYPAKLAHNYLRAHIQDYAGTGQVTPTQGDRLGLREIGQQLAASPAHHAVLSAPGFETLPPQDFRKAMTDLLGPAGKGLRVFGWLLPHADRLTGLYAAGIRTGRIQGTLEEFYRQPDTAQHLRIAGQMAPWATTFGKALILRAQPTGPATEAEAARAFMAAILPDDRDLRVTGGDKPLRLPMAGDLAIAAFLQQRLRDRRLNLGPGFGMLLDTMLRRCPALRADIPLVPHRDLAQSLRRNCLADAQELDRLHFAAAPVFVPALDAAVDAAPDQPVPLDLAGHFGTAGADAIAMLTDTMIELLGHQRGSWPQFFRDHAIRDLHGQMPARRHTGNIVQMAKAAGKRRAAP